MALERWHNEHGMNLHDRGLQATEAQLKYLDGEFQIIRHGSFVRCAVTRAPILLDDLKYWSVDRQEAYAGPAEVLKSLKLNGGE